MCDNKDSQRIINCRTALKHSIEGAPTWVPAFDTNNNKVWVLTSTSVAQGDCQVEANDECDNGFDPAKNSNNPQCINSVNTYTLQTQTQNVPITSNGCGYTYPFPENYTAPRVRYNNSAYLTLDSTYLSPQPYTT